MRISRKETTHEFVKKNLVTKRDKTGIYDEYECECGLRGKAYGIGEYVTVDSRMRKKAQTICKYFVKPNIDGLRIKVTNCRAVGKAFANLTPSSIHDVIEPPDGYVNGERGYWVMGIGEPVLLLFGEFEVVKD